MGHKVFNSRDLSNHMQMIIHTGEVDLFREDDGKRRYNYMPVNTVSLIQPSRRSFANINGEKIKPHVINEPYEVCRLHELTHCNENSVALVDIYQELSTVVVINYDERIIPPPLYDPEETSVNFLSPLIQLVQYWFNGSPVDSVND